VRTIRCKYDSPYQFGSIWYTKITRENFVGYNRSVITFRCFIPLPQLTEEYDRVTLLVYLDQDPSKYIVYDVFKMIFMILEIRNTEDYNLAEIFIVDLENITMGHVVKYTLPAIKKLEISALVSQCRILSYLRITFHPNLRRL
jgi:hypothetical protein